MKSAIFVALKWQKIKSIMSKRYIMKSIFDRSVFVSLFMLLLVSMSAVADEVKYPLGDVNGDQEVNVSDVSVIVELLLGNIDDSSMRERADVDGDGEVTITDVSDLIELILSQSQLTIELNEESVELVVGQSLELVATISPMSDSDQDVIWSSTDETVAVVENGVVTAVSPGECEVIAQYLDVMAMCHIKVREVPIESLSLVKDYVVLEVGDHSELTVVLNPVVTGGVTLSWESTDETVATVANGEVTAVAPGVCDVIVRCQGKEAACEIAVLRTLSVNGASFSMMPVRGGTFIMGAPMTQTGSNVNEKPQHPVTLSDYMIGVTEVTQELWQAVMGYTPGRFKGHPKRPVENVSWTDCEAFIKTLNELTGLNFRLPTEAQWEYAAKGGDRSKGYVFAGSDSIMPVAWYYTNSSAVGEDHPDYGTHDVATKRPNELRIYDMSGNVNEWCADWYAPYTADAQTNPTGPTSGNYKVFRGGCWNDYAKVCRVCFRYPQSVTFKNDKQGLRLALYSINK